MPEKEIFVNKHRQRVQVCGNAGQAAPRVVVVVLQRCENLRRYVPGRPTHLRRILSRNHQRIYVDNDGGTALGVDEHVVAG